MKRALIIGSGGSGKTTFARELARRTGLPLVHLDALYWHEGWRPTPADEWRMTVGKLVQEDEWIIDGNYGGTLDLRVARADTIVFLDFPRLLCLWRVMKRQFRYLGRVRPEMPAGCRERLSLEFLGWVWNYRSSRRAGILQRLASLPDDKNVVVLPTPAAADEFLSGT